MAPKTCQDFIKLSESIAYQEATVSLASGAKMMKGIRNNDRLIYENQALAYDLWGRLKSFCPEKINNYQAIGLNEQFRFYKYQVNQRFKKHIDGSFKRNEQEQSFITFLVYLNDNFKGGETAFDNLAIVPKTENTLCFLHAQKHEGRIINSGVKYVLHSDVMYRKEN